MVVGCSVSNSILSAQSTITTMMIASYVNRVTGITCIASSGRNGFMDAAIVHGMRGRIERYAVLRIPSPAMAISRVETPQEA